MSNLARSCGWCGVDISDMRANAKYCCRSHKVQAAVRRHQEREAGDHREYWRQYRAERKPDDWVDPRKKPIPDEKRCPKCERVLPIGAFSWDIARKRPTAYCRTCRNALSATRTRARRGLPPDAVLTCANLDARPDGWSYLHRGYVLVKKSGHPRSTKDGYVYEHILVAEAKYGIEITTDFTVHHLNADRQDNRPENLELRIGQHGRGGDVMPTLLARRPELRETAALVLAAYGWTVIPPTTREDQQALPFAQAESA